MKTDHLTATAAAITPVEEGKLILSFWDTTDSKEVLFINGCVITPSCAKDLILLLEKTLSENN